MSDGVSVMSNISNNDYCVNHLVMIPVINYDADDYDDGVVIMVVVITTTDK